MQIFNATESTITVVTDLETVVIESKSSTNVEVPEGARFMSDSFFVEEEGQFYAKLDNCYTGADVEIYEG